MTRKEKRRQYYLRNKESILKACRDYAIKHKDKIAEYQKNYVVENKARVLQHKDKYLKNNPEKARQARQIWTKNNPGVVNAKTRRYQLSKSQRMSSWLSAAQVAEMEQFYIEAKELQWLSEEPLEVDHIVPLQGEIISGLHVPWNLQILPKSLNCRKCNKCQK